MIRSDQRLKLLYATGDFFTLFAVFAIVNFIFHGSGFSSQDYLFLITIFLIWSLITSRNKMYYLHLHNSWKYRFANHFKSHFEFIGVLSIFYLVLGIPGYPRVHFISFIASFLVSNLVVNFLVFRLVGLLRQKGKNVRKTLVIGAGRVGAHIREYFEDMPDLGYKIVGFLDDNPGASQLQNEVLGPISKIEEVLGSMQVDEVIIALPTHLDEKIQHIIDKVDYFGIRVRLVPDYFRLLGRNYKTNSLGNIPVINVREISLDKLRFSSFKQACDIIFSVCVLLALAPLFIILAVLIKLESKGPVFYCPIRLGLGGKPFKVYKFRSMYQNDAASGGKKSTQKNDPRITKVGRIIRKYSLDELPQFFNVLLGDMSVIGPRPHRVHLNQMMQKEVDNYMIRHYLKPGITGWAQVNGWRGPTDTEEQRNNRTAHDLWYVENWSPMLDAKIIYLTVFGEKTFKAAF